MLIGSLVGQTVDFLRYEGVSEHFRSWNNPKKQAGSKSRPAFVSNNLTFKSSSD
jgi:hypothetical protein